MVTSMLKRTGIGQTSADGVACGLRRTTALEHASGWIVRTGLAQRTVCQLRCAPV